MKSLAELKRAIKVGTVLETVAHSRPVMIGTTRVVEKAQTNCFASRMDGVKDLTWTNYPPAKDVTFAGPDTFTFNWPEAGHFATLRIVEAVPHV